jgi:Domain of unknown function (DUF4234)
MTESAHSHEVRLAEAAPTIGMVDPARQGAMAGAVAAGLQMQKRNPWAAWLGLPLVTLGIYHLVWYYKIHKEMAEFDRRRAIPVAGPMLVLLLLGWTVIAPLVSYHNAGKRVQNAQRAAGLPPTCSPALSWLLVFAFGANTLYLQMEINKVVDRYGGAPHAAQVPLFI